MGTQPLSEGLMTWMIYYQTQGSGTKVPDINQGLKDKYQMYKIKIIQNVSGIVHLLENSGDPPDFDNGQEGSEC